MTTTITGLDDFKALDPFFRIIEKGLEGIADGGHFFDLLAEDVIFDYIITTSRPASWCSSTPPRAESFRPAPRIPTGTSRYSRSPIARSITGATTSTPWRSST